MCASFKDGYKQIKTNIGLFEQPESGGVFKLCQRHSCYKENFAGPIGVFDIELSLKALDDERSQDRIDLILFHKVEKKLRFFEVKTFDNNEIWPRKGKVKVSEQIARYRNQVTLRKQDLLAEYKQYVRLMQKLCFADLPEPTDLDTEPDLLLIGFDTNQLTTIKQVLVPAFGDSFRCCRIGKPDGARQETLARWWNNR